MNESRKCEWCATPISIEAVKCPNCNEWRKDIRNDKYICYTFSIIGGLILGWSTGTSAWSSLFKSFSLNEFISSTTGWVVVISAVVSIYYYIKVSKKIGTWWWV